jgi:putative peptidoglycan lipid II flippase
VKLVGAGGRRVLAVAALAAAVTTGAPAPPADAAARPPTRASASDNPPAAPAGPLLLTVTNITPTVLTPASTLTVHGTLRNTTDAAVTSATVALRTGGPLTNRAEVAKWQSARPQDFRGIIVRTQRLSTPVAPGAALPFSLVVPAAALGLDPNARTAEPVALAVSATGEPATTTFGAPPAVVRTFAVWQPKPSRGSVRLSILVPVTQPVATANAGSAAAHPVGAWDPRGRLTRVLQATADTRISWAVDPALLDSAAAAAGSSPTRTPAGSPSPSGAASPSPTVLASSSPAGTQTAAGAPGSTQAKAWLAAMTSQSRNRDVSTLPWGDPDLTALAHADATDLLAEAETEAAGTLAVRLHRRAPLVAWPGDGAADARTLHALAAQTNRPVVLNGAKVPGADVSGARLDLSVSARGGEIRVAHLVLSDPALSADVATGGGVLPTQHMLADLAAAAQEHPGEALLVTAPRTWNPDPDAGRGLMATVAKAPWVQLVPFTRLAASPAPQALRQAPVTYTRQDLRRELPAEHVTAVAGADRGLTTFAPALIDAPAVVGQLRPQALSLVGLGWRGRSDRDLAVARTPFTYAVDDLYAGLRVDPGSTKNLLAKEGLLPISVRNALPYGVKVMLVLTPLTGQLSVRRAVKIQLDPNSSHQFFVPVRAIANGDVFVVPSFRTPDGSTVLSQSPRIEVRVRSDWETRGLGVLAVLLALLLLVGLARGVRRGRTRIPPESVPDPDDVGRVAVPETPDAPARGDEGAPAEESVQAGGRHDGSVAHVDPVPAPGPEEEAALTSVPASGADTPGTVAAVSSSVHRGVTATLARVDLGVEAGDGTTPAPPTSGSTSESVSAPLSGSVSEPASRPASGGVPAEGTAPPFAVGAGRPGIGGGPEDRAGTARLLGSSAVMAAGTLLSRILGMVRVVVLAWAIGAAFSANAFSTANTLPNSLFLLIGGGVLNAVLVPQIVAAMQRPDGGREYVDRLLTLSLGLLAVATLVVTAAAPLLLRLFASPDWDAAQLGVGVAFAFWCLPQVFFYGLYTVLGQVLNARGSFGPYMWAPVVNNVVAVAGMVVFVALYGSGDHPATWWTPAAIAVLAGTTTLGVIAQALVLVPVLRRTGFRWRPRRGFRGVGLRSAGQVAGWTFAALVVGQLGLVLVSRVANRAGQDAGQASTGRFVYDTAYLLFMLPHSLVAVSVVTAVFTRMSHAVVTDRLDAVRADVSVALRTTGVATVVATAAFAVLGQDLTSLLFATNSRATAAGLAWTTTAMVIGLVPFSAQYLFQRVFYAFGDARTPFWVQVLVVALWSAGNLLAGARLTGAAVVVGIGVAMSVSNIVGAVALAVLVRRRIGGIDGTRVLSTYVRCAVAAVLAGILGWAAAAATHLFAGDGARGAVLALVVGGGVLLLAYVAGLRLLRVRELNDLAAPLRRLVTT